MAKARRSRSLDYARYMKADGKDAGKQLSFCRCENSLIISSSLVLILSEDVLQSVKAKGFS